MSIDNRFRSHGKKNICNNIAYRLIEKKQVNFLLTGSHESASEGNSLPLLQSLSITTPRDLNHLPRPQINRDVGVNSAFQGMIQTRILACRGSSVVHEVVT